MTIAVTGGTGFVGQAVIDEACRRGQPLRALARREQAPRDGVEWVRGDLADRAALSTLVEGTEAVLHIAGVVNTPDPMGFHLGNVAGTEELIAAAAAAGVRRFVLVSSLAAREPALSRYGKSKQHAEEVVQASGLDWTIVRPPAIYGPRDREILEMFRGAKWGIVPMPPQGRASMIHVEDLARLLLALPPSWPGVKRRTFEPDDGRPGGWSHAELAKAIGEAVGRRVWAPAVPARLMRAGASLDKLLRGRKAKLTPDRIGYMLHPDWVSHADKAPPPEMWRAEIPTPEGLKATAAWYREQRWL
ncbi:MAG TPA: NAD(P)H-binding protein [Croceibacterium sp.]|nr:NAD(P)H-binding protein [Croceibacterium sp.]